MRERLTGAFELLGSNSRYRWYFLARFSSVTGTTVAPLGLAFAVLQAGGGPADLSLVLVAGPVIFLLVMPVAGVAADRFPRQVIIITCQVVSGLTQAATAAAILTGTADTEMLAGLALLTGAAGAFFQPAMKGLLPQLVDGPMLAHANALLQLAGNGIAIGGPALAGLVIAGIGPGWVLAFDALSFGVSAVIFLTLRLPPISRPRPRQGVVADLAAGWSAFTCRRWLWVLTVQGALTAGCWAAGVSVLGPVYADRYLDGAMGWGVVNSAIGVGLAAGSVASLLLRPARVGLIVCGAALVEALLLVAMAAGWPLPLIAVAGAFTGAGGTMQLIAWTSYMQEHVPDEYLSRVLSITALVGTLLVPVFYALAGPSAEAFGIQPVLWACTAIVIAAAAVSIFVTEVRQLSTCQTSALERQLPDLYAQNTPASGARHLPPADSPTIPDGA
ncbi:MFS transporter (plasmid) [Streptosporangium sp. CA-135522]|uniref:MFS transporter n=1 Tax=Streptosporangium sp. CA-135522 TaxID=3240072 RepID=UPI003D9201D9